MKMKKIIALMLSAILLLGLTGCAGVKTVDAPKETPEVIIEEEVLDVDNKSEKQSFYDNLNNIDEFNTYGNAVFIDNDGKYMFIVADDNGLIVDTKPINTTTKGEKVNLLLQRMKTGDTSETYYNIQVIKGDKMKDMWYQTSPTDIDEKIEKEKQTIQKLEDITKSMWKSNNKKFIHSSTEGVDTVEIAFTKETMVIRLNPETQELHSVVITSGNQKMVIKFDEIETTSLFVKPESTIKSQWHKDYVLYRYLQS